MPTAGDIAYVPAENLYVSRVEFGAVWAAAEELAEQGALDGTGTWYTTGVVTTCRWVALSIVRPREGGLGRTAHAPITKTHRMAFPELIEAESLAAELLLARRPIPEWLLSRPDWAVGVDATFAWVWRRTGPPPVAVEPTVGRLATRKVRQSISTRSSSR